MLSKIKFGCAVLATLGLASVSNAAVLMSSDVPTFADGGNNVHNGGLAAPDGKIFTYWDNGANNPAGWSKSGSFVYTGAFIQTYANTEIFNNTGETVVVGSQYTLEADLGERHPVGSTIDVYVRATENSDGTGASFDLAQISRAGTSPVDGDNGNTTLANVQATGAPALPTLAGYFIQVEVVGGPIDASQSYYFDNIAVTNSAPIPEPATAGLIMLGGSLFALKRRRVQM